MFDINAPIERQFSRDGQKVLAICNSGLDCKFPIAAWFQGSSQALSLCSDGSEIGADMKCSYDIITRPGSFPLIVSFNNVWIDGVGPTLDSVEEIEGDRASGRDSLLAQVKITFDPNTGESSAETVWQKEAK